MHLAGMLLPFLEGLHLYQQSGIIEYGAKLRIFFYFSKKFQEYF
jgi:hypothetical protein